MGRKGWHERGYLSHFDGYSVPPGAIEGDDVLDLGHGCALLGDPACAEIVARALLFHDGERFAMAAWCVMPNHVHALLTTRKEFELGAVVRTWKQFSANQLNKTTGRRGPLWAADYFDRYMRDQPQFDAAKHYIEMNPVSAGLCDRPADWRFSSAGWVG